MKNPFKVTRRKAESGYQVVQLIGLIILSLMVSALAIDFGYYYAVQNQLQTDADASSMAAVTELYRSTSVDPNTRMNDARTEAAILLAANHNGVSLDTADVVFGYVDPVTKIYNPATFSVPNANPDYGIYGGFNAVWTRVRLGSGSLNNPLNTVMANFFGVNNFETEATSVAMIDNSINGLTGLRPIYACEAQFNLTMQDGIPENNVVRVYGDHMEVDGQGNIAGCPAMGSGNWGFADLRDCNPGAVGNNLMRDWVADGFPDPVFAGQCYSTQPGNFLTGGNPVTQAFETLVGQTITVPLYDSWGGGGSNTSVNVSGFAGFVITQVVAQGNTRYIEGYFTRSVCNECTGSGGTAPGGAVVKLRLASRS